MHYVSIWFAAELMILH